FFSSRRRHTRSKRDWSSDVCSSDLPRRLGPGQLGLPQVARDAHTRVVPRAHPYEEALVVGLERARRPAAIGIEWGRQLATTRERSEERRVGKECRCGWAREE